jgi:hypothetical protein
MLVPALALVLLCLLQPLTVLVGTLTQVSILRSMAHFANSPAAMGTALLAPALPILMAAVTVLLLAVLLSSHCLALLCPLLQPFPFPPLALMEF